MLPIDLTIFYYDIENNVMIDEDGTPRFDIFEFITPSELFLFKQEKENAWYFNIKNSRHIIELIYPEPDYIEDIFYKKT